MELPDPDRLRAVLSAARDCGVTRLKLEGMEVELAPVSPGERVIDEINRTAPIGDPIEAIRRQVGAETRRPAQDVLDVLANGGRLIDTSGGDPTRPV